MTAWQIFGIAFGLAVYPIAWFRGGRPERFGAGVLLFSCLLSMAAFYRGNWVSVALEGVSLLIFGWLCFRSNRWWPFLATAAGGLTVLLFVIRMLDPGFSQYALVSAFIGLDFLIDLALLLGVWERGLAGERPAGPAAWLKAERATAANRRGRPSSAPPPRSPPSAP